MTTITKTVDVDVRVDIDLDDFSTEELIDELEARGANSVDHKAKMLEIYEAFHQGRDAEAVALTKAYVCDELGRVL